MAPITASAAMLVGNQARNAAMRQFTSTTIASSICARCRHSLQQQQQQQSRPFTSSTPLFSGHNRWSKIRHEKGAADKKKTAARNVFSKHLTLYSKLYGPDPKLNSQLDQVIQAAKKSGMPKANIDAAVARGQGRSTDGKSLEVGTLEVLMNPNVSLVIETESDHKMRSIKDLRQVMKKHSAVGAPTAFQFTRLGRILLEETTTQEEDNFDDVLMSAVEAGAEDVEQAGEGAYVIWTQPTLTQQVAQAVAEELDLKILSSDIVYKPTAELVEVDDEGAAEALAKFLEAVKEYPDTQAIYSNAVKGKVSEALWERLDDCLDD